MSNIYYDPDKFGLEIVAEIDCGASYEFDKFVVWRKTSDGTLWYCADSGCSCPSPFEDEGINDLQPYSEDAVRQWAAEKYRDAPVMDVADFIAKCK